MKERIKDIDASIEILEERIVSTKHIPALSFIIGMIIVYAGVVIWFLTSHITPLIVFIPVVVVVFYITLSYENNLANKSLLIYLKKENEKK